MMYYTRVAFAFIGGVLAGALNIRGDLGLLMGVAIFLLTYLIFRYIRYFSEGSPDKKKLYMTGIFSFFLLFLAMWILSINLFYPVMP